jgi:hypothetical protein
LVRRAFDRRVNRKVRKSSTFRPVPFLDNMDQGECEDLAVARGGVFLGADFFKQLLFRA